MALGFILFLLFCILVLSVSILIIISIVKSIKFYIKYKKSQKKKKSYLVFSIIGVAIGVFLIIILINIIFLFTGNSSQERTKVLFISSNELNDINEIVQIKQSITSNSSNLKFGFFKYYEKLFPSEYSMDFSNISENVKKINIISIDLIINNDKQDITNKDNYSDIIFKLKNYDNSNSNLVEMIKLFRENRVIIIKTNNYNEVESFKCMFNIRFDYEIVEYITIIYDIDIELNNGDIINVKEEEIFYKNILIE